MASHSLPSSCRPLCCRAQAPTAVPQVPDTALSALRRQCGKTGEAKGWLFQCRSTAPSTALLHRRRKEASAARGSQEEHVAFQRSSDNASGSSFLGCAWCRAGKLHDCSHEELQPSGSCGRKEPIMMAFITQIGHYLGGFSSSCVLYFTHTHTQRIKQTPPIVLCYWKHTSELTGVCAGVQWKPRSRLSPALIGRFNLAACEEAAKMIKRVKLPCQGSAAPLKYRGGRGQPEMACSAPRAS